jgi:hypothetical protein
MFALSKGAREGSLAELTGLWCRQGAESAANRSALRLDLERSHRLSRRVGHLDKYANLRDSLWGRVLGLTAL